MKDLNQDDLFRTAQQLGFEVASTHHLGERLPGLGDGILSTWNGITIIGRFAPEELITTLTPSIIGPEIEFWHSGVNLLVDVKNPKTAYGRNGLNNNQVNFAARHPMLVLATVADVLRLRGMSE